MGDDVMPPETISVCGVKYRRVLEDEGNAEYGETLQTLRYQIRFEAVPDGEGNPPALRGVAYRRGVEPGAEFVQVSGTSELIRAGYKYTFTLKLPLENVRQG